MSFSFPYVGEIRCGNSGRVTYYSQYMPNGCWNQRDDINPFTKDLEIEFKNSHILGKSYAEKLNKNFKDLYGFRLIDNNSLTFTMKNGDKYSAQLKDGQLKIDKM